jgi:hypothetical protein
VRFVFADELARVRHVHFKQAVNDVSPRANRGNGTTV